MNNTIVALLCVCVLIACDEAPEPVEPIAPVNTPNELPLGALPPEVDPAEQEAARALEGASGEAVPSEMQFGGGDGSSTGGARPPPRVRAQVGFRVLSIEGPLSRDVLRRIMRARVAGLRRCYETRLRTDPEMSGEAVVSFSVSTRGTPENVRAVSGLAPLAECVMSQVNRLRTPMENSASAVTLSVEFSPR